MSLWWQDSDAYKVGAFCFEVIALYTFMVGIIAATADKALGIALALQLGAVLCLKHVILDKSGPPPPMLVLYVVNVIVAWYEVGWADYKPATEKAFKMPMKLHATIVATGFVPYYIIESLGISIPFVGAAAIDSSFTYNGNTAMMMMMLAVMMSIMAEAEYTGRMPAKVFVTYHYFLSTAVLFWQMQPSTSMIGAMFFMPPHIFTALCIYLLVTKEKSA